MARVAVSEILASSKEDRESNKKGKPALRKFMLLPNLLKQFSNKEFNEQFLDYRGLEAIYKLIEPLPDGCLPLNKFREKIFNCLKQFDVKAYQLKESQILSQELKRLLTSNKESKENKKTIRFIIAKWSRVICQKITDYALLEEVEKYEDIGRFKKEFDTEELKLLGKRGYDEFSGYDKHKVMRPKRMGYQFFNRPSYENLSIGGSEREEHRIRKYIDDLKKREKRKI